MFTNILDFKNQEFVLNSLFINILFLVRVEKEKNIFIAHEVFNIALKYY